MLHERIRERAEGRKQLEQNYWLGFNIKFLKVRVKTLGAGDYVETLRCMISKIGLAKPKVDSLEVQKENTSEGFPTPFPNCPSVLRHMTFPILWFRSFWPSSFKAQSISPNATFSSWN
jgi:hypothetical protein